MWTTFTPGLTGLKLQSGVIAAAREAERACSLSTDFQTLMAGHAPCRFGFVAFEKKEDCQRAFSMCGKNMFLIGDSARPVIAEMARTEVTARHSPGWL